ncbi:MAG: alcohol dehydrogenase catalytic domain-containing protein [Microcella sp.]|uniref:zinc-dependent alcohol dehydrogenase n=1 Tax=Microcella sp. TaxID=1913979 RepID=UPI003315557C
MTTMTALVLREFGTMAVEQVPHAAIGEDEVQIAVSHTGICGSDVHGFTGENGRRFPGQVMGHESEGTIAALGAGVSPELFPHGQRVTFNPVVVPVEDAEAFDGREQHCPRKHVIGVRADLPAAFADLVVVPARNVVPIHPEAPRGSGALVEPLAVAAHAVRRSSVVAAQRVLVAGGGPIGQSLVIALRMTGVEQIVVSEPDPARRDLVALLGAIAVDPLAADSAVYDGVVAAFGAPADVAFDAVGVSATLANCLAAVSLGGTVCLVGMGAPHVDLDAFSVSTAERTIVGTFTYSADAFREASRWIEQPGLGIEHLISAVISPHEAPAMFTQLAEGHGPAGKVLVAFNEPGAARGEETS